MEYQILALDLDGTLTNSKKEISRPTLEALIDIQKTLIRIFEDWKDCVNTQCRKNSPERHSHFEHENPNKNNTRDRLEYADQWHNESCRFTEAGKKYRQSQSDHRRDQH